MSSPCSFGHSIKHACGFFQCLEIHLHHIGHQLILAVISTQFWEQ